MLLSRQLFQLGRNDTCKRVHAFTYQLIIQKGVGIDFQGVGDLEKGFKAGCFTSVFDIADVFTGKTDGFRKTALCHPTRKSDGLDPLS